VQSGTGFHRSRSAPRRKVYRDLPTLTNIRQPVRVAARSTRRRQAPRCQPCQNYAAAGDSSELIRDLVVTWDRRHHLGRISAAKSFASLPPVGERRSCDSPRFGYRRVRSLGLHQRPADRRMARLACAGKSRSHRPQSPLPPAPARCGGRGELGGLLLPHEHARGRHLGLTVTLLYPERGQLHEILVPFSSAVSRWACPRRSLPAQSRSPA
jgi:hypothetical protein